MIREATINDVNTIVEIIHAAWQKAFEGIIDPAIPKALNRHKYINIFTDIISNKLEKTFVFEQGSIVCGYISGKTQPGCYDCEVLGLYIHPDMQGKGIGGKLLNTMKSHFRDQGCKNMTIYTLTGAKNNQFYIKHGGLEKEHKEVKLGSENYPETGFSFNLEISN